MNVLIRIIFLIVFGWLSFTSFCLSATEAPASVLPKADIHRPAGTSKGAVLVLVEGQAPTPLVSSLTDLTYTVALVDTRGFDTAAGYQDLVAALRALAETLKAQYPDLRGKPPILLGSGKGAKLVYQALAHTKTADFHAGISLDFCPNAPPGIEPESPDVRHLPANWYVFQSAPACDRQQAASFIGRIDNAQRVDLTSVPAADGKPSAELTALLQWLDPGIRHQTRSDTHLAGVALTEVRARSAPSDTLAILLSGDGGWATIDRGIAGELAKQGVDTVGWDSLSYFWQAKTPEKAAGDLDQVIAHYAKAWHKTKVMLIGYSFGADALPFLITRLSPDTRPLVKLAAFLGLGLHGSFEFHLSDWFSDSSRNEWPTQPEVRKLGDLPRVCLYGAEETDSGCPGLENSGVKVVKLVGDHHFNDDYPQIVRHLLQDLH